MTWYSCQLVRATSELPSSTDLPYFIRKSVINTEVRIPVIKYGNMKIQTCVYIAATVANTACIAC